MVIVAGYFRDGIWYIQYVLVIVKYLSSQLVYYESMDVAYATYLCWIIFTTYAWFFVFFIYKIFIYIYFFNLLSPFCQYIFWQFLHIQKEEHLSQVWKLVLNNDKNGPQTCKYFRYV